MTIIDEIIRYKSESNKNKNINEMISKNKFKNNFLDLETSYGNFKITVLGIGGAGCNVIGQMKSTHKWPNNVQFYAMNTDVGSLKRIWNYTDVWLLGKQRYRGGGSGGNPVIGENATNNDKESIAKIIEGTDLLFLIAGLGKGTGSGAMPVIAKLAKEKNICTICLMHLPSVQAEGSKVYENALESFKKVIENCNSYCTISNDKIISNNDDSISLLGSFMRANEEISNIVAIVTDIVNVPTTINVDFADVHNFFMNNHSFMISSIIIDNQKYTKRELFDKILRSINSSYCNLSIDKTSNILANIDICEDTSRNIIFDIKDVFVEISKNNDLWLVNGINYHKDDSKLKLNFLISSNGTYNNDLNSNINQKLVNEQKKFSNYENDFVTNKNLDEIQTSLTDEENKVGISTEDFIDNSDEDTKNIHRTRKLDSRECNRILTEALHDVKDIDNSSIDFTN